MANYPARSSGDQTVNYLRAPITFAMGYTGVTQVGTLPAGCAVLRAYAVISTAFNNGSTNSLKIGSVGSDAAITAAVALGTIGVASGTIAANALVLPTADTPLIATGVSTGSASTAGSGVVIVEYAPVT